MKTAIYIFFLLFPCFLQAQVKNLALPGFQWHEPTAWSPMGVPTANDSVTIHAETFIMPDSIARAKYVLVGPGGTLDIQRDLANNVPGILVIQNSPGVGFKNEGDLVVGGRLTIKNTLFTPLFNTGSVNILNRAKIIIDSTALASGILNTGTITSNGLIEIDKPKLFGIQNLFEMTFEDSAQVIIHGYDGNSEFSGGINNLGAGAVVTNHGSFEIDGFDGNGIINRGQFDNFGELFLTNNRDTGIINTEVFNNWAGSLVNIDSTTSGPGVYNASKMVNAGNWIITNTDEEGILNEDSLTNETGGYIEINKIDNASGIINMSGGNLMNDGSIHMLNVDRDGLINNGVVSNNGFLDVKEIYEDGIQNNNHLINQVGGIIHTLNTGSYGFYSSSGALNENYGKILIDSAIYGIYIRGQFHNYDSINFNIMGDYSIELFDTLYNYAGGVINVIDGAGNTAFNTFGLCENYGLMVAQNFNKGISNHEHFLNEGEIILSVGSNDGIDNNGQFINKGMISIDSTEGVGFDNDGSLTNFDTIHISNTHETGLMNEDTLYNQPGGYIQITTVEDLNYAGIKNGRGSSYTEFLNNEGVIRIDGASTYGLWNQGIFILAASGDLQIMNTTETPLQIDSPAIFECLGTLTVQD